jgi:putative membrane protein
MGPPDQNARAMMIEHYSDHAANERTFLAWVRTAIAVMAFGFLVERFDLFLQIAGQTLARRALSPTGQLAGNVVGLILIGLGAATIILALLRFRRTARQIDSPERLPGSGERLDLALAALLVILGTALFVYLSYTVISRF